MKKMLRGGMLALTCATAICAAAQSIYPGSADALLKVKNVPEMKAQAFPLSAVRLLPGRLLSAYALMHAATGAEIFKLKADSLVDGLAEVQKAIGNGYISAFPEELINRNMRGQGVWAPWYTLHKILAGLIDQYVMEGNQKALEVATQFADWAYRKLDGVGEETRRLMLRNEFGGMNEAWFNLYAITGDTRHLRLAEFFHHNEVVDPLYDGVADFGTRHTNTFIPKMIAEARRYELTGSRQSARASQLFWDSMLADHCFATGSLSQKEHFFRPDQMSKYINGYTGETCCTYNMLKLGRHLFCREADSHIADYTERALFNHILAQQDPESGMVCYFLPLLSGAYKVYSTPEQSFWCCVGSGFESHAKYAESIYYRAPGKLYVNLLAHSRLDWADEGITLTQTTDFPVAGTTRLHFDKADGNKATIALRKPEWCKRPQVRINGKKVKAVQADADGYINLTTRWKAGDNVEAEFPMELHLEYAHGDSTRAALLYGPIVLAGDMGTEGMEAPAPFSDPTVRNDYYTYDYHIPAGLNTTLSEADLTGIQRREGTLEFTLPDGRTLRPLYDLHHRRYTVYWDMQP